MTPIPSKSHKRPVSFKKLKSLTKVVFVLKRFWFIFFSLQPQFCSSIWVFWKKQASYHFLLGKHLTVYFHLIRKQEVWQSTLKENPPLNFFFFSWNGTMCPRSLFTQSWKYRETCLVKLKLGPDGKRSIFILWKLDIFSFIPGGKTHWFISLFIAITALVRFWVIWRQQAGCHFLLESHLTVQFNLEVR